MVLEVKYEVGNITKMLIVNSRETWFAVLVQYSSNIHNNKQYANLGQDHSTYRPAATAGGGERQNALIRPVPGSLSFVLQYLRSYFGFGEHDDDNGSTCKSALPCPAVMLFAFCVFHFSYFSCNECLSLLTIFSATNCESDDLGQHRLNQPFRLDGRLMPRPFVGSPTTLPQGLINRRAFISLSVVDCAVVLLQLP